MCFSPEASFATSALLSLASVATFSKVKFKSERMLAAVPLLFGLQQFAEGILWVSFSNPNFAPMHVIAKYMFLLFAFVIWPIWVPLSLRAIEKYRRRRTWLFITILAGLVVATYFALTMMEYKITASIMCSHIAYILYVPKYLWVPLSIGYLMATVVPFFISSVRNMWFVGMTLGISYFITLLFYFKVFLSVWCFFSAILSILIFTVL